LHPRGASLPCRVCSCVIPANLYLTQPTTSPADIHRAPTTNAMRAFFRDYESSFSRLLHDGIDEHPRSASAAPTTHSAIALQRSISSSASSSALHIDLVRPLDSTAWRWPRTPHTPNPFPTPRTPAARLPLSQVDVMSLHREPTHRLLCFQTSRPFPAPSRDKRRLVPPRPAPPHPPSSHLISPNSLLPTHHVEPTCHSTAAA